MLLRITRFLSLMELRGEVHFLNMATLEGTDAAVDVVTGTSNFFYTRFSIIFAFFSCVTFQELEGVNLK